MTGMFLVGPLQHKLAKIFSEIMTQIEDTVVLLLPFFHYGKSST
jgi:hypothetical protein